MTTDPPIPLVDILAQNAEVADEVNAGFEQVLSSGGFISGPAVASFEQAFASYCEVAHCVGAANGTDALELLLRALEISAGDEVILPANTFIATAEAVARTGAQVVLVDCIQDTLLIDVGQVASRLTAATRAIIGVDLFGQMPAFTALADVVDVDRIALLEDAAQSQGARQYGHPIGSTVVGAATSFYPGKNLGAYGDAGAVITNDDSVAARVRAIGNHGSVERYHHEVFGFNSRLDALQAVVLNAKLKQLDAWNEMRRRAAARYDELLAHADGVTRTVTEPGNDHVWHLYVVRVAQRDRVLDALHESGIGAGIHYPFPVHLTGAFHSLGYKVGDFPVAESAASSMVSLPMFPHITEEQQQRVVNALIASLR